MSESLVVEILLGVLALAIGIGSFVGASRAAKVQAIGVRRGVEAGAYQRATDIYESAITSMESQMTRLREETVRLRQEIAALNTEVDKLHVSNRELATEVIDLRNANMQLINDLRGQS